MIKIDNRKLDDEAVLALYQAVGWVMYTRDPAKLKRALAQSLMVLGAFDGDRLVGLIRAVGDGETILFIQDLLVLPNYQRQGIGRQLVNALVDQYPEVRQRVLLTDDQPDTRAFYEKIGFVSSDHFGVVAFYQDLA
ncbi:GNAT family N-acetyltransferase [Lacticaseibacillus casei]|jgi:GNAT superfamily N-acetyltransferase|uniref:GNAT family N-acetyltransferase n=1 Tax=Lacticaseibacillus huelsenbergensis TaxID=3035291 RepID=A0ABY8DWP8_9LACO|nr:MULTISPECIES: GNAT family N-acetyltransferase [Lacticaseibacillus]MDG3060868.1 GNAT family N-acetyltransferase [Lacticaseibacillus sp. BCRC 81376]QVI37346.1 GNAT family N-acetyltransferase [Lacticaseibacillus casei]QXG59136.1 GNAT family N-acetyltransferase [Lacticaseibacillus casei]WFB39413.1 GNAT family N-acetyltransferase [Lacticaseibacillus huelsenbergensis]WFB41115.1 GNAT family N-acetyltransferase [Lacticaseibacillus huelsenbergensis]